MPDAKSNKEVPSEDLQRCMRQIRQHRGSVSLREFYEIVRNLGLGHTRVTSWFSYDGSRWLQLTDTRQVVLSSRAWRYLNVEEPDEVPDPYPDWISAFLEYLRETSDE